VTQWVQADDNSDYLGWKTQILGELDPNSVEDSDYTTYAFGRDTPEMRRLVKVRSEEAYSFIANNRNDPVLWWIKGELGLLTQVIYHIDLKEDAKENHLGAAENQSLIKKYLSYYRKALDADDAPDARVHLDGKQLVKMVQDVLSPPDIKIRAARKVLDMSIAGGQPPYGGEVASHEWYMYEFLLSAYAEAGDIKLYIDTVNEMIERYPDTTRMDELLAYKQDAEGELARLAREAAGDDSYAQAEPYTEAVEEVAQVEPYVEPEVVSVENSKMEVPKPIPAAISEVNAQKKVDGVSSPLWSLLATGGVIVLFIIAWYGLRRRKRVI